MSLRDRLVGRIAAHGPLTVADYMDACLHDPRDGYYATRPALGEGGDFLTAPHTSQMFGELIGLWAAETWTRMGGPPRFALVELGPGDGTLMSDILRAGRAAPGFNEAAQVWLVETSDPLRALQAARLGDRPRWADELGEVPRDAPVILAANEFLDCLPIRQAVSTPEGWRERRVGVDENGALRFEVGPPLPPLLGWVGPEGRGGAVCNDGSFGGHTGAPHPDGFAVCPSPGGEGGVVEFSPGLEAFGREVAGLLEEATGAALFIDYGRSAAGYGDTLQALRGHAKEGPLENPGSADLTAWVDFPAFLDAAAAPDSPILSQGVFLRRLGIEMRAAALAAAHPEQAGKIMRQLERLIGVDQMGELFKVVALGSPGVPLAGFEAA